MAEEPELSQHAIDAFQAFKSNLYDYRLDWLSFIREWLGSQFIRDFACPFRALTRNPNQLWGQLMYFCAEGQRSAYTTVYSFRSMKENIKNPQAADGLTKRRQRKQLPDYSTAIIKRVFFDLDSHSQNSASTPKVVYEEAKRFKETFGDNCTIIWTGAGVHAYVHLNDCITKQQVESYQNKIALKLNLTTSDAAVYGDCARVLRVPYSIHKTGNVVLPVNPLEETLQEIQAKSESINILKNPPCNIRYRPISIDKLNEILGGK
jgi:hypothetical protein